MRQRADREFVIRVSTFNRHSCLDIRHLGFTSRILIFRSAPSVLQEAKPNGFESSTSERMEIVWLVKGAEAAE